MKKIIALMIMLLCVFGLTAFGCDDDDDTTPPGGDTDDDDDTGTDTDTDIDDDPADTDTDVDTDGDTEANCGDSDSLYPPEFKCTYDTTFVKNCCFEYAKGISEADAEADCKHHRQGGHPPSQDLILGESNWQFGTGPCTGESSGYCYTKSQTPAGREYTPIQKAAKPENDCKPAVMQSSAWGCETMGSGKYCCAL